MSIVLEEKQTVVIKFAGDSGDGMQLAGSQFTNNTASQGYDLGTFPDFPAEIRAPQGTLPGVSGFQIHFGSDEIYTPGDTYDVLVAMNAAALKTNLHNVKKGGVLILNTSGFDARNLRLAGYESNPLDDGQLDSFIIYKIDITKLTREALQDIEMGLRDKDRSKNMFVLGFIYWLFNRNPETTIQFIERKFKDKDAVREANIKALKTGYNYGDITEAFSSRYVVKPAKMPPGKYRSITGNPALALGLIAAAQKTGLQLFYGTYPITPASDVLQELAKYKNFNVKTFQAEDEIAAVTSAIGASFGGNLGVTGTSGPGLALKAEAIGLAVMLELPLLILDIQRAGPSTGMPTKTEQSDLLQAVYGRNGECPMPVLSASTPSSCFEVAYNAVKIAVEHMTPVLVLSDNYIANGAEPWRFPKSSDLEEIKVGVLNEKREGETPFLPYERNDNLVRAWAIPGIEGYEHRVGGLEKEDKTGAVSYDPDNHEKMVKIRQEKVDRVEDFIPEQETDTGADQGKVLVLGWGSTYGAIRGAVSELVREGLQVSHAHLTYINPFPKNLGELMTRFDKILIPEINNGQLIKLIREKYLIDAVPYNKIKGIPITRDELVSKIRSIYPTE